MIKQTIRRFRIEVLMGELLQESCYWWTLTTKDSCDYKEIARRWRTVRHWLSEKYPVFKYIQNFELHPQGHGWHIHFVCNAFVSLRDSKIRSKLSFLGFGRVSCQKCYSDGLHEYLTKHALKSYRLIPERDNMRFRLVNVSRSLECPLTRFKSVFGLSDKWSVSRCGTFKQKCLMIPFEFIEK